MLLGNDHSDRVGDQVVGKHVANVDRRPIGAEHIHVDVETNVLWFVALMGVGANADRQDEIAHENAIGLDVVLAGRISARRKKSIIDFSQLCRVADKARIRRDQSTYDIDCLGADARGAVSVAAQRAAKSQDVGGSNNSRGMSGASSEPASPAIRP